MKKSIALLMLILLSVVLLCSCASTNSRVQQALDKMKNYDSVHIEGVANATVEVNETKMDMDIEYDIKVASEDIQMSMKTKTGLTDINVEYYFTDGKFYMYMPQLLDKYIDASSMYEQIMDEGFGMDLTMFDFDVDATELEPEDTTIDYKGKEEKVLKVKVMLNEEQMTKLVKELFEQQNFSTDTLSGQAINEAASIYESIDIESAEYTLYIDGGNNILRYEVAAVFSADMLEQNIKYDMKMTYDIIDIGDTVKVELPDIKPEDTVTFEELLSGITE